MWIRRRARQAQVGLHAFKLVRVASHEILDSRNLKALLSQYAVYPSVEHIPGCSVLIAEQKGNIKLTFARSLREAEFCVLNLGRW